MENEKSRTIQEVSKDLLTAGFEESPPEPKKKTPEEMAQNPEKILTDEEVTGD